MAVSARPGDRGGRALAVAHRHDPAGRRETRASGPFMPAMRFSLSQFSSRMRILSTWIIVGGRICRPAGSTVISPAPTTHVFPMPRATTAAWLLETSTGVKRLEKTTKFLSSSPGASTSKL